MTARPIVPVRVSAAEEKEIAELLLRNTPPPPPDLEQTLLDTTAADNAASKNQKQWIPYFNERHEIMAAMPDLYHAGKSGNAALLANLQKDFQESRVILSTRIDYSPTTLKGTITHYADSTIIPPRTAPGIIIPDYSLRVFVEDVLHTPEGVCYLQTLFNTSDDPQKIQQTLKMLNIYDPDKTRIWTPNQESRKQTPARAAGLLYIIGVFHVSGFNIVNFDGRSRGVRRRQ